MKSIKVYLQYPWVADNLYYKNLIVMPPKEVKFFYNKKLKEVVSNKKFFWFSNFLKRNIRGSLNIFNLSIPNSHLSPKGDYDLIHCAHCLSKNKDKPWVADFESEWQMFIGNKTKRTKEKVKRILLNKNCKKILPWTKMAANEIIREFPEIRGKVGVVYPMMSVPKIKIREHKGINLLFVGRYFYEKGGFHALKVFDALTKKYENVNCILVSDVPKKIIKKYEKDSKIKIYGLMLQKKLFDEIYPISDIFVYPGYSDTFGFAYLEAMSFGIPIITVDGFARKEIIGEGKTGFIIKSREKVDYRFLSNNKELIEELIEKTEQLIKNKKLREKMSKNCVKEIEKGKFSIKERNRKLKKIYKEALK